MRKKFASNLFLVLVCLAAYVHVVVGLVAIRKFRVLVVGGPAVAEDPSTSQAVVTLLRAMSMRWGPEPEPLGDSGDIYLLMPKEARMKQVLASLPRPGDNLHLLREYEIGENKGKIRPAGGDDDANCDGSGSARDYCSDVYKRTDDRKRNTSSFWSYQHRPGRHSPARGRWLFKSRSVDIHRVAELLDDLDAQLYAAYHFIIPALDKVFRTRLGFDLVLVERSAFFALDALELRKIPFGILSCGLLAPVPPFPVGDGGIIPAAGVGQGGEPHTLWTRFLNHAMLNVVVPLVLRGFSLRHNALRRDVLKRKFPQKLFQKWTEAQFVFSESTFGLEQPRRMPTNMMFVGPLHDPRSYDVDDIPRWITSERLRKWTTEISTREPGLSIRLGHIALPSCSLERKLVLATFRSHLWISYRQSPPFALVTEGSSRMHHNGIPDPCESDEHSSNADWSGFYHIIEHNVTEVWERAQIVNAATVLAHDFMIARCNSAEVASAIRLGAPILCFPQTWEEHHLARRLENLGAAIVLDPSLLSEDAVINSIVSLASENYVQCVKRLESLIWRLRDRGGSDVLGDLLLNSVKRSVLIRHGPKGKIHGLPSFSKTRGLRDRRYAFGWTIFLVLSSIVFISSRAFPRKNLSAQRRFS